MWLQNAINVLGNQYDSAGTHWMSLQHGHNLRSRKNSLKKCCMDVLCTLAKLYETDLQILGRILHQNAFGGRAPPGHAGGAIALPKTP